MTRAEAIQILMRALDIFERTTGFEAESFDDRGQPERGSLADEAVRQLMRFDVTPDQVLIRLKAWRLEGRRNTQGRVIPMQRCDAGDVVQAAQGIHQEQAQARVPERSAKAATGHLSDAELEDIRRYREWAANATPEQLREHHRQRCRDALHDRRDLDPEERAFRQRAWDIMHGWDRCEYRSSEMFAAMCLARKADRQDSEIHSANDARSYLQGLSDREARKATA